MTWTRFSRAAARGGSAALLVLTAGCNALDVSDPTVIEESDLDNAAGAELMRNNAIQRLYLTVGAAALTSGLLSDEFFANEPASFESLGFLTTDRMLDQRRSTTYEDVLNQRSPDPDPYSGWNELRTTAAAAMERLRVYMTEPVRSAYIGQMFAVRGFATLRLAEDFCPGLPLKDVVNYEPTYSPPLSTDELLERAVADFDSALVYAVDTARFMDFARIGRARALLGLGRFAEAGAEAVPVATEFVWDAEFSAGFEVFQRNPLFFGRFGDLSRSLSDSEGGTGLDFISAGDPRVQPALIGTAEDGVTPIYANAAYQDNGGTIPIASGLEARLIQAEAALQASDGSWLTILNDLRATQIDPALPALTDPGTAEARVDLLFRERAFWLFSSGHRLADLRRLMTRYSRPAATLFPSGPYHSGGSYEDATSIPFPGALERASNPAVIGCASR